MTFGCNGGGKENSTYAVAGFKATGFRLHSKAFIGTFRQVYIDFVWVLIAI